MNIEFQANDSKMGMTLDELKSALDKAVGMRDAGNMHVSGEPPVSHPKVQITFTGKIKKITVDI